ncbi:MAG: hypothetical protein K6B28_09885 [Lachnospiraceae bacterium]|nr:hypothetical protein [Lachnospiraceae bacterium]
MEANSKRIEKEERTVNTEGKEAYCRVDACGEYVFEQGDRIYHNKNLKSGQWVMTQERVLGEEYPNHYDIWRSNISDTYMPGEEIDAHLTFRVEADDIKDSDDIWGSMYFSDTIDKGADLDDELVIRKYFKFQQNDFTYDPIEMSHFSKDNDGLYGKSEGSDGDLEYYFEPCSNFPRICAENDTIFVVLDISDSQDKVITRYIWEYTFRLTEKGSAIKDENDQTHEGDPEYYSEERKGHWDMTDIKFIGGNKKELKDGDIIIKAERYGVEGEDMVYTYNMDDGSYCRLYLPEIYPDEFVYADGSFYIWIKNTSYSDPENTEGILHCSLALADVEFNKGEYGIKVHPQMYFESSFLDENDVTFEAPGRISFDGVFPAGDRDGDKIYLVYGVMDGFSGNVRMYNVYEYTYSEGPEIEWIYNPPMY